MHDISKWKSLWKIWKNGFCGSKKRRNPGRFSFCFADPQENRIRTFRLFIFFVLLYSVILGLRPCWGADMRGRIVNNIFWCSGWCGSGFSAGGRGFRPPPFSASSPVSCWGVSNTTDWYVKRAGAVVKLDVKERIVTGSQLGSDFFLFGPAETVFSDSDPDPHFPCLKLKLSGCWL